MELFDSMDSSLAEFLGVNEYELLSKQAKVSSISMPHFNCINDPAMPPSIKPLIKANKLSTDHAKVGCLDLHHLYFALRRISSEILDYQIITNSSQSAHPPSNGLQDNT